MAAPTCEVRTTDISTQTPPDQLPPCGEPAVGLALRVDFAVSGFVCQPHSDVALNRGYIVQPLALAEQTSTP